MWGATCPECMHRRTDAPLGAEQRTATEYVSLFLFLSSTHLSFLFFFRLQSAADRPSLPSVSSSPPFCPPLHTTQVPVPSRGRTKQGWVPATTVTRGSLIPSKWKENEYMIGKARISSAVFLTETSFFLRHVDTFHFRFPHSPRTRSISLFFLLYTLMFKTLLCMKGDFDNLRSGMAYPFFHLSLA